MTNRRTSRTRGHGVVAILASALLLIGGVRAGFAEVGQEMKRAEEAVTAPVPEDPSPPSVSLPAPVASVVAKPPAGQAEGGELITSLVVKGDSIALDALGMTDRLRSELVGRSLTLDGARDVVAAVNKQLIEDGYYLAYLWVAADALADGVLTVDADMGRVGNLTFSFEDGRNNGRFFSQKQLARRMQKLSEGNIFQYRDLYSVLFEINSHPDITINTDLHVRKPIEEGRLVRYADAEFRIEEKLPIHVVAEIDNYGTEATDDWRVGLTVQHLNLTKHDDVLTFSAPVSLDFQSMISVAASYYWPYYACQGGGFTFYGGYSELDAPEVVTDIDIVGQGWFGGFQWSQNVRSDSRRQVKVSLGVVRRYIEDQLVVSAIETEPRAVEVMPMSAALSYTAKKPDILSGRNFAALQVLHNIGDFAGTSDTAEMQTQRTTAESDYTIAKLQLARVQTLFGDRSSGERRTGQWVLFAKAEGQIASGALVPAEEIGVGGAKSVRGYLEREYLGDHGAYGSIELRTPILLGLVSVPFASGDDRAAGSPPDRLQLVTFVDGGYAKLDGGSSQELLSVGLGFRFACTRFSQLKFDWGFPLEVTDESDHSGTGHLSFQLQF